MKFDRKLETKDLNSCNTFREATESRSKRQMQIFRASIPAKAFSPVPDLPHGSYNVLGTPCSVRFV